MHIQGGHLHRHCTDRADSTADSLMQEADQAMYLAKHNGGDCQRHN
jgi:GGDEF domain-containing protein